jgi:hypothetical protein
MNREIKFRGQRIDNNEWVYGYLFEDITPVRYQSYIIEGSFVPAISMPSKNFFEVKHETVGQYTELKDKNGVEIYEGDILRETPKNDWEQSNYSCFEVFFHSGDANTDYNIGFTMNRMHNHGSVCGGHIPSFKPKSLKNMCVIGNIYENPELLNLEIK